MGVLHSQKVVSNEQIFYASPPRQGLMLNMDELLGYLLEAQHHIFQICCDVYRDPNTVMDRSLAFIILSSIHTRNLNSVCPQDICHEGLGRSIIGIK